MAKTAVITTRIEPELKEEVETVLNNLGLTTSQAITLYFQQIAFQQEIPFSVQHAGENPQKRRQPGSAKGILKVLVEDDQHLDDFKAYMA